MGGHLLIYVVARDFGFAPNPFHGICTLATCMARVRNSAQIGDWVMGVGGSRLKATGRCIYLMKVSEKVTFNEYWSDDRFRIKKPLRNGSLVMMVGDNIYHQESGNVEWFQEDSHHSMSDGSFNLKNLKTDTASMHVLISDHFYYFGGSAPTVDLASIGYRNIRTHRKVSLNDQSVINFIKGIEQQNVCNRNRVLADPFDFSAASKRVDQATSKIT